MSSWPTTTTKFPFALYIFPKTKGNLFHEDLNMKETGGKGGGPGGGGSLYMKSKLRRRIWSRLIGAITLRLRQVCLHERPKPFIDFSISSSLNMLKALRCPSRKEPCSFWQEYLTTLGNGRPSLGEDITKRKRSFGYCFKGSAQGSALA